LSNVGGGKFMRKDRPDAEQIGSIASADPVAEVADVNSDGRPDVVVCTRDGPGTTSVPRVFINGPTAGSVRWSEALNAATGVEPGINTWEVLSADVDGDADDDLVLLASPNTATMIAENVGGGTYKLATASDRSGRCISSARCGAIVGHDAHDR